MWLLVASQAAMCSEEIEKLAQEKYAGSDLLMMSVAELDIHQRCKRKLDNAGADEAREASE